MSEFKESVKETLGGCLVLIVLGVIGLVGFNIFLNYRSQKEIKSLDYSRPVRKYSDVQKIWDEKQNNSINFMSEVNNKMVYVTGRITKDGIHDNYVLVKEEYSNPFDPLSPYLTCNVRNKDILSSLESGLMVKVAGLMDFKDGLSSTIDINHCLIKRL